MLDVNLFTSNSIFCVAIITYLASEKLLQVTTCSFNTGTNTSHHRLSNLLEKTSLGYS